MDAEGGRVESARAGGQIVDATLGPAPDRGWIEEQEIGPRARY
jgi:hypothetical protein